MVHKAIIFVPYNTLNMKVGVLGAGHLGKIHIQQWLNVEGIELVGFFDPNPEMAEKASQEYGVPYLSSINEVIQATDIVDIVTPTLSHFECAKQCVQQRKHVFIEKPVTNTVEEAKQLSRLVEEADIKMQVGHVERFNPAFIAAQPNINDVRFIETHRLAQFNPRGTDVSVILDLMIHDLDIVLSTVKSNVKKINASGVAVVSDTPDIANARLEFDNGCVANLTASRISLKNMRKSRFFQKDAYISVDFLEKKTEIVKMKNVDEQTSPFSITMDLPNNQGSKEIIFENPDIPATNAIREELSAFCAAIKNNTTPIVTIEDGLIALDIAHQILSRIDLNAKIVV